MAIAFKQKRGVGYDQTYSPTVEMVTLRVLLSLAVQNETKLKQLNIKTAYLNAGIEEEILLINHQDLLRKMPTAKAMFVD